MERANWFEERKSNDVRIIDSDISTTHGALSGRITYTDCIDLQVVHWCRVLVVLMISKVNRIWLVVERREVPLRSDSNA